MIKIIWLKIFFIETSRILAQKWRNIVISNRWKEAMIIDKITLGRSQ